MDRAALLAQLAKAGYEHMPTVAARGQYAVRGGILDVFSFHHSLPVRVELFDDEIESLREFDLDTQTSVRHVDTASFLLGDATTDAQPTATTTLRELIRAEDLTIDAGADFKDARVRILEGSALATNELEVEEIAEVETVAPPAAEDFTTAFLDHGLGEFEAGDFVVDEMKRERFFAQLREWRLAGWRVHIFCNNEGEIEDRKSVV